MQSRWLLNLILLLAVIGLGTFMYVSQQKQAQQSTLTTLDKSTISRITIPRADKNIELQKQADGWRMTSPFFMKAHEFRINRVLDLLATEVEKRYDIAGLDLKQFDLDPPRAEIRFDNTSVLYGKTNPVNQKRYIRVGDVVCLISDDLYPLISAEPSSFVDLALLPEKVEPVMLQLPAMTLTRQADKSWKNSKGETIAADRIQHLLDTWRHAQGFGAHAYMQREKSAKVVLGFADNSTIEFDATLNSNWLILGRKDLGVEYHLAADQAKELFELKADVQQDELNLN